MGASGTKLYENDFASDVREDYIEKLRRGKTNEETMQEIMEENREIFGDMEEEPIFWFALADTQWDYGRLTPYVKEKALEFLFCTEELERWRGSGEKQLLVWMETRRKLKEKLLSSQPQQKKVYRYRLYKCKWQLGDVFAYQFAGEYSKQKGMFGKYIVFRKVSEDTWWPGHIIPTVHVYQWIGDSVPTLAEVQTLKLLPQKFLPIVYANEPQKEKEYFLDLIITADRQIPQDNLTYLGNISSENLKPNREEYSNNGYDVTDWGRFERFILEQYSAWNKIV